MTTINSFLETGKRALITHQDVLSVIGHNISNVNTEGYSRQRANLKTTIPMDDLNYGQIGTGVSVSSITRARDELLDVQVRTESSNLGRWDKQNSALAQIEDIFNEPSSSGFNDVLADFWDAWADLANDPTSSSARTTLRERSTQLTETLNGFDEDIKMVEQLLNEELRNTVQLLNSKAIAVAELNVKIRTTESVGQNANDLRDERDLLLDEMAELADIRYTENSLGSIQIYIDSHIYVQDKEYRLLDFKKTSRNEVNIDQLVWKDNNKQVNLSGGKIKGILQVRDEEAEYVRQRLDELATTLVEKVNELHSAGYGLNGSTGFNFFDPDTTGAGDIGLTDAILDDLDNIAAGGTNAFGDNSIALDIAALADQLILNDGKETFGDFYSSTIANLGSKKQTAELNYYQADAVNTQLANLRQSVQGVVLDEELTEMIKFQRAYGAAAQIVNVASSMMDTIIKLGM